MQATDSINMQQALNNSFKNAGKLQKKVAENRFDFQNKKGFKQSTTLFLF